MTEKTIVEEVDIQEHSVQDINVNNTESLNDHPQMDLVIRRLSKIIGHTQAIKRMCEEGRPCNDILTQIAAVRSALNGAGRLILQDHIKHCVVDAVQKGDEESLEALDKAIAKLMK